MSRRCLQFEEAQPKAIVNSSLNLENNVNISRSPGAAAESETFDSSHGDSNATFSSRQLVNKSQPMATVFRPCNSGKSSIPVSKPSGIGLHLNSITNAVPMGHGATAIMKLEDGYMSVQGMKSACFVSRQSLENIKNGSKLSNLVGEASAVAEDRVLETKASVAASSAIPESLHTMVPLSLMQPTEHHATPRNKRKFISEHTNSFEEVNQQSSKKKKKKSSTTDGDGCKRCNCKKTKCLKLYCDCFAAGIYCADPCACRGCFNRPEYEDTVLETRQQIESRNPFAFAPKIVQHVPEFPAYNGEDGNLMTPSSARHKRGCNCKKSMCLKKYCECYQANVGCSTGCRCEGCKNVYGRKDEQAVTEELVSNRASNERSEGMFDDKMEMVVSNKDFLNAELYDLHKLTPLTPSFQCSDHGKDAPKSRSLCRRYLPSPDSDDLTMLSSYAKSPRSPRNSDSNDMTLETSKEISEIGSYVQGMDYSHADMVEYFSSKCHSLADVCHLTPLPNLPSMSIASSVSSKPSEWTNGSRLQLCSGSGDLSSAGSSLHWRSSSITPMTQLGGSKSSQGLDSSNGLDGILEDDTPEILKDASTPIKSLKVSSPKCKRISPPHGHMHELGLSSSGALKSGRKFILKAMPSFPSLTPCIKSKGITHQTRIDSEQNSSKE